MRMLQYFSNRRWLALPACLAFATPLCAQEVQISFLLHPQGHLGMAVSGQDEATLAPHVDRAALSFAAPQILVYKDTPQAEFVSAAWKDASGRLLHQRDVFVVKPDYGVVVDYLYEKAQHVVSRSFTFPAGPVAPYAHGAFVSLSGKNEGVLVLDGSNVALAGNTITSTSNVTTPIPLTTILQSWSGSMTPALEYVKPSNPMIVKFNVTFPDRVDQIALAWESRPLHLSEHEFKGWAACLRRLASGSESSFEIK